ncbi:SDR family oxidoreductase [[Brevibacterium] frigoritolerans]|nr:SDR family oxidoreductase [Peribacillus frigoritolerans]
MIDINLSGQTALITGGASGIGRAITQVLTKAGAKCIILDKETPADLGLQSLQVDLANPDELTTVLSTLTDVDILVNNAGILGEPRRLDETPVEHLNTSWAVNLRAPMLITQALVPHMRNRGQGVIVNIASIAAFRGSGTDPAYAAMKAGLVGLTKSLAQQYGPFGIRSLAVCPGSVRGTRLLERARGYPLTREESIGIIQRLPLGRTVMPEDVATLVAFLVSPLAASITGVTVTIDSGEQSS